MSSISPRSLKPPRKVIPTGFLPSMKPQGRAIDQLSHRELHDLWNQNQKILAEPAPSTSSYHQRIVAEQLAIGTALGMATLQHGLHKTHISQDEAMDDVSMSSSSPSRTVDAKRRAVGRYHANTQRRGATAPLGLDEAMELEHKAYATAQARQKHELEKRLKRGLTLPGDTLTREERDARIWAFMNVKPTESDEEDEDWEEDEDEDPSTWFEDEEEDGRKGQPLVDPDEIASVIRVDDNRWG